MAKGVKIELGKIQETLLLPLWGRAVESQKKKPRLIDKVAIEIISTVDYDFSTITQNISWVSQFAWVARSLHVDNAILGFIKDYPKATIVNIGCGLDTTFDRIDNGQINFYDLDLPDVIDLRKKFFEENERRKTIACSFLDNRWFTQIQPDNGVFFIAAGVFYYFDENQIRDFFKSIAGGFRGCEIFFDSASPLGVKIANKKVIRDGGMDETAILKWGIKSAGSIEEWDEGIRLVKEFPMFKGMKRGLTLKMKYGLWMSDLLKIISMVHLKME
ncbi:MAG: class I SAM-dependent methyltransferase [Candidatus Kryptoniota bacterium]